VPTCCRGPGAIAPLPPLNPALGFRLRVLGHAAAVVLKVGGIAHLGTILRGKGAKKSKGSIGGQNNTKGVKIVNH